MGRTSKQQYKNYKRRELRAAVISCTKGDVVASIQIRVHVNSKLDKLERQRGRGRRRYLNRERERKKRCSGEKRAGTPASSNVEIIKRISSMFKDSHRLQNTLSCSLPKTAAKNAMKRLEDRLRVTKVKRIPVMSRCKCGEC